MPKPAPAKQEPPKPPQPEDDFSALLKSVENLDKRITAEQKRDGRGQVAANEATPGPKGASSARTGAAELVRMIREQIEPCWNVPVGARSLAGVSVTIHILMAPDGSVRSATPLDAARMGDDPIYRAVAESAQRAALQCSPLKLPREDYDLWNDLQMIFRPDQMG